MAPVPEALHQRGRHVQHAHGRRSDQLASDGSHLSGGMIALMPSAADAKRLAIKGGEAVKDLHLTLFYLGPDATVFDDHARAHLIDSVQIAVDGLDPVAANIFGVAHWNAGGDSPSWVWNVGDGPDTPIGLTKIHATVCAMIEPASVDDPQLPDQHTPWAAHICAAYTEDLTLLKELENRLGPVTFDRVAITFGSDATEIPLTAALTAGGGVLRRNPKPFEEGVDFLAIQQVWQSGVDDVLGSLEPITAKWQEQIFGQIREIIDSGDLARLRTVSVDTGDAAGLLFQQMTDVAEEAAHRTQDEAEAQGVKVGKWTLAGRKSKLMRRTATAMADIMGNSMTISARRYALAFAGEGRSGEDVAGDVLDQLGELKGKGNQEAVGAALTAAQNAGRRAVMEAAPPARYYSSEILDKNTCGPCRKLDGTEFATLEIGYADYPTGGYRRCDGFSRCRGMIVARWDQATTASANTESSEGKAIAVAEELGGKPNEGTRKDKRLKPNKAAGETESTTTPVLTLGEMVEKQRAEKLAADDTMAAPVIPPDATTAPWQGPLAIEGTVTGDGREFAAGKLTWQDPPLPLRWNKEDSHGGEPHTVAVNVGRIDRVWRDGNLIMGEGVLNLAEPDGQRAHDLIKGEFLRGVSIDADSISGADIEYVMPEGTGGGAEGEEPDLFEMLFTEPEKIVFHGGRIRAATLCDIPAFAEAYIALTDTEGAIVAGGNRTSKVLTREVRPVRSIDGLVAHGGPEWKAPSAWFVDPQLSVPTGITVTDEGRVYGHAAMWGACHIGQDDVCVQPPHEESHPYFMTGEVIVEGDRRAAVGQITVGTNHAGLHLGAAPATEHYEHTGHAVADVCVGNDAHGIWVAGAIRPGADPLLVHELRASGQVSGDWRRIGSSLRLVGLLAVNIPGFPVPKLKARVASGRQEALVAAGRPTVAHSKTEQETVQQAFRTVMDMLFSRVHEGR
jgi:hypothetical protein